MEAFSIAALQTHVCAPLVTLAHPAYDDVRRVWNGIVDRRPLLIVQPERASEVAAAIAFARDHGLPLTIRTCSGPCEAAVETSASLPAWTSASFH